MMTEIERPRYKAPRNIPFSELELENRETIYMYNDDLYAYIKSPGYGNAWIQVYVVDTEKEEVLENPIKQLRWFYGDIWPKMVFGFAEVFGRYYICQELVVGYEGTRRLAIRTHPAPDAKIDFLESSDCDMWIDPAAYVKKVHVAPVRDCEVKKRKPRTNPDKLQIENPDDVMHKVEL